MRFASPSPLYAITPDTADTPALLCALEAVLSTRPALLQYRNKCLGSAGKRAQAGAVAGLCRDYGVPLVVNDDPALARMVRAQGVHLGRDDGDLAQARQMLGPDAIIGVSCYNDAALARQAACAGADYVAMGAVFPSATKPQAVRVTTDALAGVCAQIDVPVVAIGGITLDNAPGVLATGVRLLAVISDVFDAVQPGIRAQAYAGLLHSASD